jgi:hypothetical protein
MEANIFIASFRLPNILLTVSNEKNDFKVIYFIFLTKELSPLVINRNVKHSNIVLYLSNPSCSLRIFLRFIEMERKMNDLKFCKNRCNLRETHDDVFNI